MAAAVGVEGSGARRASGDAHGSGFRPDIEGLRAVAVGLVLLYHAGLVELVPGGFIGVDVFFVISGFLITGLLIRELERDGKVSLPRFYARRAKRLLPAAGVTLIATAVLTWASASVVQWRTFGPDIVGAALYAVNWVLANRSVDYLAEDVDVSPVQHFWSLAVEEQFYLVWPLLLVLVAWWMRRRHGNQLRVVMAVAIGAVIVPSFLTSLVWTASNPAVAFFVTPTRLWELGIGAFVAIGAQLWPRIPDPASLILGWSGLAAVLLSAVVLTEQVPWPGYAALWPTVGTAMVIVAGFSPGRRSAARLLACRPAVWIGGLSYSLYLWHWPLLVAAANIWGGLGGIRGMAVVAATFIPAYLSHRFVENPIRFSSKLASSSRRTLAMGASFTGVGVLAGLMLAQAVPSTPSPDHAEGAAALHRNTADPEVEAPPGSVESLAHVRAFVPQPADAPESVPAAYSEGCQQDQVRAEVIACEYGDDQGEVTVAVVGDSKILQWLSAIDAIAAEEGWRVIAMTKSECSFSSGMQVAEGEPYVSCDEWNNHVLADLLELQPALVLVSGYANVALDDPAAVDAPTEHAMEVALADQWGALADADIPTVVILDNPSPQLRDHESVYECVAEHPTTLHECVFDRQEGYEASAAPVQEAAAARVPGTELIDMSEHICPMQTCVPVIGDVLIYRQTTHITDLYVRTLTEDLAARLVPVVEEAATRR